jgi:hypothetical protein
MNNQSIFATSDVLSATDFLKSYLNLTVDIIHETVVFYDRLWVAEMFSQAFTDINRTNVTFIDGRNIDSPKVEIETRWLGRNNYLSILDLCCDTTFPNDESSIAYTLDHKQCDVTTLEAARHDLTDERLLATFRKVFACSLQNQTIRADAFYGALGLSPNGYEVIVRSGLNKEATLTIDDTDPWMEICGGLKELDVRFLPSAELFYSGNRVNGQLICVNSAFSLLPLRSNRPKDYELYLKLLEIGKLMSDQTVTLTVENRKVIDMTSSGSFASRYHELTSGIIGLNYIVEVGIGLSYAALPLERSWGATNNEAASGVHLGLGADPTDTTRFETDMHLDFVCPEVEIIVNNQDFFRSGQFVSDIRDREIPSQKSEILL